MSTKIFVSHAAKDKVVVDEFLDMLQVGIGIHYASFFCSSIDGMDIPSGKRFVQYIEDELAGAETAIICLSQHFLESQFCLCELGAVWAIRKDIFPILIPPLTFEDVRGIMIGMQLAKLDSKSDLNELFDKLKQLLNITQPSTSRWDMKCQTFLANLPGLLSQITPPETVRKEAYDKLAKQYQEAVTEGASLLVELDRCKKHCDDIKKLKDRKEVSEYEYAHSTDKDRFDELAKIARKSLRELDIIVRYMIFKDHCDETPVVLRPFDEREKYDDACKAVENKFLIRNDNEFWLNKKDPLVQAAMSACEDLHDFLSAEAEDEFIEAMCKTDTFNPELDNRRFWETYLDLRSSY